MKTAIIETYDVRGTRTTKSARVMYRGQVRYEITGNHSAEYLIGRAVQYAAWNGFDRALIDGKPARRIVTADIGANLNRLGCNTRYVVGIAAPEDERETGCTIFRR